MGWLGGHLHAYDAGGVTYQLPDDFDSPFGRRTVDERKARLGKVLSTAAAKMTFDYDFGDGWQHDVIEILADPNRSTRSDLNGVAVRSTRTSSTSTRRQQRCNTPRRGSPTSESSALSVALASAG
jgi:Plasmid pRiA4b ORF-3-like protein